MQETQGEDAIYKPRREAWNRSSPWTFWRSMALLTPWLRSSGLWNWDSQCLWCELPHQHFVNTAPRKLGFPQSSIGKESTCDAGDPGLIPGSGRSAGEGIGYPLQYSWATPVAQLAKNPPAMRETWVGKIPWRRERLPTPVFWAGEFHGLCSPWGHKESNRTERLSLLAN